MKTTLGFLFSCSAAFLAAAPAFAACDSNPAVLSVSGSIFEQNNVSVSRRVVRVAMGGTAWADFTFNGQFWCRDTHDSDPQSPPQAPTHACYSRRQPTTNAVSIYAGSRRIGESPRQIGRVETRGNSLIVFETQTGRDTGKCISITDGSVDGRLSMTANSACATGQAAYAGGELQIVSDSASRSSLPGGALDLAKRGGSWTQNQCAAPERQQRTELQPVPASYGAAVSAAG